MDAIHVSSAGGVGAAIFAWVAERCSRVLGPELTDEKGNLHADLAPDAEAQKLNARRQFNVRKPPEGGSISIDVFNTSWVRTWKKAGGRRSVKARLVARGYWGPDLEDGNVDTSGCVSLRLSVAGRLPGGPQKV